MIFHWGMFPNEIVAVQWFGNLTDIIDKFKVCEEALMDFQGNLHFKSKLSTSKLIVPFGNWLVKDNESLSVISTNQFLSKYKDNIPELQNENLDAPNTPLICPKCNQPLIQIPSMHIGDDIHIKAWVCGCASIEQELSPIEETFLQQHKERGFSDREIYSITSSLANWIVPRLQVFIDCTTSTPIGMSLNEWKVILKKILYSFQLIRSEYKELIDNDSEEDIDRIDKAQKEGFELFIKYIDDLWW